MRSWQRTAQLKLRLSLDTIGVDSRSRNWGWLVWIILVSVLSNTFVLIYTLVTWPKPLVFDNWTSLHNHTLVNAAALALDDPIHASGNVIATGFYTDEFATAVAALGDSLSRLDTTARLLMLYIPAQVSPRGLCIARTTGFTPHPVARIPPPNDGKGVFPHFLDQYTKLRLWELDALRADAVVYLDADTLALRNFDELFALPYDLAAVPDVYPDRKGFSIHFNAGVLLLRPDSARFREFVDMLASAPYAKHEAEQAFLNVYYAKDVLRLPYAYNGNLAIKKRSRALWEGIRDELRVVHYTMVKPFTRDNKNYALVPMRELEANARRRGAEFGGVFREEMELWAKAWAGTYARHGDRLEACMLLSDIPEDHGA